MKSFDFQDQLAMSSGTAITNDVADILLAQVPGGTRIVKSSTKDDRSGTDYWVDHVRGTPVSIDCKIRSVDPVQKYGKDDLVLETLSVVEKSIVGWSLDEKKRTDYVLWWFTPTHRWVLVPFLQLVHSFGKRVDEWGALYGLRKQQTTGRTRATYHSEAIFVPRRALWAAICQDFSGVTDQDNKAVERVLVQRKPAHIDGRHIDGLGVRAEQPLRACEHCGKHRAVMLAMTPGRDGIEWRLCSYCWRNAQLPAVDARHGGPL